MNPTWRNHKILEEYGHMNIERIRNPTKDNTKETYSKNGEQKGVKGELVDIKI